MGYNKTIARAFPLVRRGYARAAIRSHCALLDLDPMMILVSLVYH